MAITYVGGAENSAQGNTTTSVNIGSLTGGSDSAPSAGDLIIAAFGVGDDDNTDTNVAAPTLTGVTFTEVADLSVTAVGDDVDFAVFYGYYAGSDTTLDWSGVGGTDASNASVVMVFRGVRAAADGGPFDVASTTATLDGSGSPNPPSINHSNASGIWIVIAAATSHLAGAAATYTFPTGYTTDAIDRSHDDTNDVIVGMGYRNSGVSDPEDPGTMTFSGAAGTNSWAAVTMALREAAAVTDVSYDQAGFRGRNDDGSETTATWKAAENTDWSQVVDTNFRVRFVVDETASGTGSAQFDFKLQYNKNGAGWNDVNEASSVVRTVSSGNVSNGTATTQQLSSGSGTYVAGSIDSNNGALGLGNSGAPIDNGERSEGEWVVQVRSADVVGGDTIDLRVVETTGSVVLDAYSQVPTITVDLVSYTQAGFRGRNDDGSETTATWKAAENTNWTQAVDENVRVRFVLDETTGGTAGAEDIFQLQYRLNGGTWTNVDAASNVVRVSTSPNVANATATTRQLSSGTGTFEASEFDSNNGLASATGPLDSGNLTEPEYCVQIRSADVVADDTVELRVIRQDAAVFAAYSNTPSITVGGTITLVIADATHAHSADNLALTQHNVLAIQDASHGHAADNVSLGINLVVQDAVHGHTADNLSLTQHHVLAIQDASHGHAADNLALTQHNVLAIADASHAHAADNIVLTQHNVLVVADAAHAHAADNLTLSVGDDEFVLEIQDAAHAHTADALVLGVGLVIADALHGHAADNLTLTQHNVLAIDDALHAHDAENIQDLGGEIMLEQHFVRMRRRKAPLGTG